MTTFYDNTKTKREGGKKKKENYTKITTKFLWTLSVRFQSRTAVGLFSHFKRVEREHTLTKTNGIMIMKNKIKDNKKNREVNQKKKNDNS